MKRASDLSRAALLGTLALPALVVSGSPMHGSIPYFVATLALTTVMALVGWRFGGRGRSTVAAGAALSIGSCWLLTEASFPGSALVAGGSLGFGVGPIVGSGTSRARLTFLSSVCAAVVAVVRFGASIETAAVAVAALVLLASFAVDTARTAKASRVRVPLYPGAAIVIGVLALSWVGSTSPSVTWFGSLTSHGPASGGRVALTFDDGPNDPWTREVAAILESAGTRGTFFVVGKAVEKQPAVVMDLAARGHTVANHSFHHDAWRYLDPRYPELMRAQRTIARLAGFCPALFRPPHGTHTPFMSRVVGDHGPRLVTWNVSAKDWAENDPERLARSILAKAKPGAIILLHDGIDGQPPADRSVVVEALPAILTGLRAKGMTPVTVDVLLGVAPYLPLSECG